MDLLLSFLEPDPAVRPNAYEALDSIEKDLDIYIRNDSDHGSSKWFKNQEKMRQLVVYTQLKNVDVDNDEESRSTLNTMFSSMSQQRRRILKLVPDILILFFICLRRSNIDEYC